MKDDNLDDALAYHRTPLPGKISVVPTKALDNQRQLALAYSPGVAHASMAIYREPDEARLYTSKANLVGVISNGTAVLGLGNIGALAAKPVMEGKACLFKKFAGIDVFDLEMAEHNPDKLIDAIAILEPTFGGINLEDIKAPECFYIEQRLIERMNIPVFHDDQHGTAIVASAALINGLELAGKKLSEIRLVCSGAGAAAIASLELLVHLGLDRSQILLLDSRGVVYAGREANMEPTKARFATAHSARTLTEAIAGADVFLGCSAPGLLNAEMVQSMAANPVILALANPEPEIRPEVAHSVRPDAIVATGRSDYPNQVNNVLCFPFLFRGALDSGASRITPEMKMAAVHAIAGLARREIPDAVARAYPGRVLAFSPEYIIPTPFDPRLVVEVATAVAEAAVASGVARHPIPDMARYRSALEAGDFTYALV